MSSSCSTESEKPAHLKSSMVKKEGRPEAAFAFSAG
jgi:hypothetical protein